MLRFSIFGRIVAGMLRNMICRSRSRLVLLLLFSFSSLVISDACSCGSAAFEI